MLSRRLSSADLIELRLRAKQAFRGPVTRPGLFYMFSLTFFEKENTDEYAEQQTQMGTVSLAAAEYCADGDLCGFPDCDRV